MIALWLLGCGSAGLPAATEPPAEIHTRLDGSPADGGGFVEVQEEHDAALEVEIEPPDVAELRLSPVGEPRIERLGDRVVTTTRWRYEGKPGHYEIGAFTTTWKGPDGGTLSTGSPSLFVDLGTRPIDVGKIEDIEDPPALRDLRLLVGGTVALGALVAGGLWIGLRRPKKPKVVEVAPESPDRAALRAWDRVRTDPSLDELQRATELSRIFREYTEAVLRFPATKWTTSETLAHLERQKHLPHGCVAQARALLRATDRVKYAGDGARARLFDELDADLRAFVDTTRPRDWERPA